MLRKLFSHAVRKAPSAADGRDPSPEAAQRDVETMPFAPMVPLQPPAAQNDDPLQDLYGIVEQDLRAAGYLR